MAAVLAVVLVSVGVWLVFFSSVLAVKGTDVSGNSLLSEQRVKAVAQVTDGEPLARVDLDAIHDRLEALPAVREVDVSRQWPDQVRIEITEREAIAVVSDEGRLRGIDQEGVVFRNYRTRPLGLPVLRVPADVSGDTLEAGAELVSVLPARVARLVRFVELGSPDSIELRLRDGRRVSWGSAENADDKARVLDVLLEQKGTVYDVSVPGQPTVR